MSTLLTSHLEQISLCATSISELPFPGPKIFTNALLSPNHDITALLRDTEQHERALFHLAPPPLPKTGANTDPSSSVVGNAFSSGAGAGRRATRYEARPPRNRAVAAVLGGDLYQQTRNITTGGRQKGEVDVELLLKGAEKLIAVYPVAGASDKIAQLRRRHQQLAANIAHYENRVAEQTRELQMMNRLTSRDEDSEGQDGGETIDFEVTTTIPITKEDIAREEEDIRELERKKKGLEDRVEGMERDLGGLMR